MQVFNTLEALQQALPEVADLLARENAMQYPDAKFIKGVRGSYYQEPELDEFEEDDIVVLFDVNNPNQVLYCWVNGFLEDPYIDDYMLMDTQTAMEELDQVK